MNTIRTRIDSGNNESAPFFRIKRLFQWFRILETVNQILFTFFLSFWVFFARCTTWKDSPPEPSSFFRHPFAAGRRNRTRRTQKRLGWSLCPGVRRSCTLKLRITRSPRLSIFQLPFTSSGPDPSSSWRSRIAQDGRPAEVGTPLPADSSIIVLGTRFATLLLSFHQLKEKFFSPSS